MIGLVKFLFRLLKVILFLLIVTTFVFFIIFIKYQNVTVAELFEMAKSNFFIALYLLGGGIVWSWLQLILFRVMQYWLIIVIAAFGILLCAASLIKAHKFYRFLMIAAMVGLVVMAVIAFINAPKDNNVFNSSAAIASA